VGLSPNSKKLDRPSGVKICTSCGEGKSLEDFYTNGYSPLGKIKYKGKCKECEQQVKYEKFSNLLKDYLNISNRKYACESCGYTNIFGALDWHHINPNNKDFNISDIPKTISSENFITNVMPELDKCKLLCPNCHRLEHIFMGRK
jgi:Zn finger protein HypA/HybF involved in hydrogenase expression